MNGYKNVQVPDFFAELVLLANRCDNGSALPDFTSPSEKLVCRSFTLGRLINTSRANWLKWLRSRLTTCSSNVPEPLM
ncbi:hypothetical protein D9M69_655040 [compost metagenome]